MKLITEAFEYALEEKGPIYRTIKTILLEYYKHIPEEALRRIAEKAGVAVGFIAGRMLIGRYIAASVAKRILLKIAASEGFKRLSIRLGFGTAASGTGGGAVVTLLMFQGVDQRASDGRKELENAIPALSKLLKQNGNLDLLYFLIKDPMQKHLQGIQKGQEFPKFFEEAALQVYVHAEGY